MMRYFNSLIHCVLENQGFRYGKKGDTYSMEGNKKKSCNSEFEFETLL